MKSDKAITLAAYLLRAKFAIVSFSPLAMYAAVSAAKSTPATASVTSVTELTIITWGFIIGFSMLGWAVSDLDKVAELWKPNGGSYEIWRRRFGLAKTIIASNAAGICTFFLGRMAPGFFLGMFGIEQKGAEIPEMLLLIFATGAGFMGARWFDWMEKKIFK